MIDRLISRIRRVPPEAALWCGGIAALFLVHPVYTGGLDLCIVHRLGHIPCPGCGLGASIHHLLHGNVAASWAAHPLGIPALAIIGGRTIELIARPSAGGFRGLRSKGAREWQT